MIIFEDLPKSSDNEILNLGKLLIDRIQKRK